MNALKVKKYLIYIFLIFFVFILDRISKIYILNIAETNGIVDIYVNSYLNLILVWNTGIGFGLLSFKDSSIYNYITILIIIINLFIVYIIIQLNDYKVYFFIIILGGSLGNLFDRIYYSAVPDFIDLNYNGIHWFIFNVADIFISFGIICLILIEFLNYKKKS